MDYQKKYVRTRKGITQRIWAVQCISSKERGHPQPAYTLEGLRNWIYSHPDFDDIYDSWICSDFDVQLRPSIDRLDDSKGYSFDNIQLTTWQANRMKGDADRISGKIITTHKCVVGKHKVTGEEVSFHSVNEASRQTGALSHHISSVCKGNRMTAGNYYWSYGEST